MKTWAGLHPLTRGLTLTALGIAALNVALALAGYNTALHHAAAFLLGSAHQDSWEPMR